MTVDGLVEPPLSGRRAEACSALVDEVAKVQRNLARLVAWQLEVIDDAVRVAEETERGLVTVGSTLSVTQRREMVRRSVVAELACALRMPESTVFGMVADADALMHRLPVTMAALRAGELSYRHARVLVDQTNTLSPELAGVVEEQVVSFAGTVTVSKFAARVRVVRERVDPESITVRVAKSVKDRRVEFQPAPDGMAWLGLFTTASEALTVFTAVRDQAARLQARGDSRTLPQITADVCTDALTAALSGDLTTGTAAGSSTGSATSVTELIGEGSGLGRVRPTVTVTVPALTLLGWGEEPATLEGYGPIDPKTARVLAGQASMWFRMLTDPKTGAPVAVDSRTYRPTRAMRRYLQYVDGTCRFTGCNRAARYCDLDHTTAFAFGGATQCENLAHLCPKHHRMKHHTTWHLQQRGHGTLEWTTPGGHTYETHPAIQLPPPTRPPDPHSPPLSRQSTALAAGMGISGEPGRSAAAEGAATPQLSADPQPPKALPPSSAGLGQTTHRSDAQVALTRGRDECFRGVEL